MASRLKTKPRWATPRSCVAPSRPAKLIFTRSTPATALSSSRKNPARSGRTPRRATSASKRWTMTKTKSSGVNAAMAYGTDGAVAALGLVIMEDPKGVQPIYAPTPIIREEALKKNPKIRGVLAPVFKVLDGPTLQALNAKIQLDGQDAKKGASDFLKSKGLLK